MEEWVATLALVAFTASEHGKGSYNVAAMSRAADQLKCDPVPATLVVPNKGKEPSCSGSFKTETLKLAYSDEALAEMHKNFEEIRKTGKITNVTPDTISKHAKGKLVNKGKLSSSDNPN